jgi:homoserine O-acetyltransferase
MGTTGPSSINPETGRPYGPDFPVITVRDMVRAQARLLDHLGIDQVLCVTGGSMGGMEVLQWAIDYPEMLFSAIPIATTSKLDAQGIAFDEVGRQAIYSDPDWRDGSYYDGRPPKRGLAVARMIGHITYLSERSMRERFGRSLQDRDEVGYDFGPPDFQVESYLRYKGGAFVERFDANSYLYITKAMDYFDLAADAGSLTEAFGGVRSRFLVISYSGDWLFPTHQSKEIVRALQANGVETTFCELQSEYGHDAFLLEDEHLSGLIASFLRNALDAVRAGN